MNVADFDIQEDLVSTPAFSLQRVKHKVDQHIYILKRITAKEKSSVHNGIPGDTLPYLLHPLEFQEFKNNLTIICRDVNGSSLRNYLRLNAPLDKEEFYCLASGLLSMIEQIHLSGWIIRDLNPDNILYNLNTGDCTLSDSRKATRIIKQQRNWLNTEEIDTLQYISPEQTGRISAVIDFRSDFYTLGILFFEAVTGRFPYMESDKLALIHSIVALEPKPAHEINPDIAPFLSQIISRLLAKNPELRYQSIQGIKFDLDLSLQSTEIKELCTMDIPQRLTITEKLIGRKDILQKLEYALTLAEKGNKQIVYLKGPSGVGKTRIVVEFFRSQPNSKCRFITAKFDILQRDIPFSALNAAIKELIRQILTEEEDALKYWRDRLICFLKGNGRLLIADIPELSLVIGNQPEVQELPPQEAQNRYNQTCLNFMEAFTSDDHILTVFIDDLQWADIASIKLLELVNTSPAIRNMLFIGAYRDQEVNLTHPLRISLLKQEEWINIKDLDIEPLGKADMMLLIQSCLPGKINKVDEFTELVFKKTLGNTFHVIQLICSLFETKSLSLNSAGKWDWDNNTVQSISPSGTVGGLLSQRFDRLETSLKEILRTASSLGDVFDLRTLAHLLNSSELNTARLLSVVINEGFIISQDENLDFFLLGYYNNAVEDITVLNTRFRFAHDSVRQAAISALQQHEVATINLSAAQYKMAHFTATELHDELFFLANNFNLGADQITAEEDKKNYTAINLNAGIRAKNASAYDSAILYFNAGKRFVGFDKHYELMYSLNLEGAVCKFLTGNYSEAEMDLDDLFVHSRSRLDKLNVLFQKSHLYTIQEKKLLGVEAAKSGYKLYGRNMPTSKYSILIRLMYNLLKARFIFSGTNLDILISRPLIKDKEQERFLEYQLAISPPIYQYDQTLFAWNTMQMLMLTHKYGNNGIASFGYIGFGMILSQLFGKYRKGQQFAEIAIKLNNILAYNSLKWKIQLVYYNFVQHWTQPVKPELHRILEIENGAFANGDPLYSGYAIFIYHQKKFALGFDLEPLQNSFEEYLKKVSQRQDLETRHFLESYYYAIRALRGKDKNILSANEDFDASGRINELKKLASFSAAADMYITYTSTLYLFGKYQEAWNQYLEALNYVHFIQQRYEFAEFNFYGVLICAKAIELKQISKDKGVKKIKKHLKKLSQWKELCPDNFEPQFMLATAEFKRITEKSDQAARYYERAISSSSKYQFLNYKALACELAGRFNIVNGNQMMADTYLKNARESYLQWGAIALIKNLETEFNLYPIDISGKATEAEISLNAMNAAELSQILRDAEALKNVNDADLLIEHYLKSIVHYSGADKAFLLINIQEELFLKAKYTEGKISLINEYPDGRLIPVNLVRYVMRTKEPSLYINPSQSAELGSVPYFREWQPRAVCCFPVLSKGTLFGVLYLENYLSESVFDQGRLTTIDLIAAQMVMVIDNASLYNNIDTLVKHKTIEIESRMDISENLLHNILPKEAIEELKATGKSTAQRYNNVSVLMADIKGFTMIAEVLSPEELIKLIDLYFRAFDGIMQKHGVEKIKTIGDAYMAAGGLGKAPEAGVLSTINAAIDMQEFMYKQRTDHPQSANLELRIGIHTGTVIAGVVGSHRYQYDIWGDTVNIAARMEQNAEPGKINISKATRTLAGDAFTFFYRGKIDAKNKLNLDMYFVNVSS